MPTSEGTVNRFEERAEKIVRTIFMPDVPAVDTRERIAAALREAHRAGQEQMRERAKQEAQAHRFISKGKYHSASSEMQVLHDHTRPRLASEIEEAIDNLPLEDPTP